MIPERTPEPPPSAGKPLFTQTGPRPRVLRPRETEPAESESTPGPDAAASQPAESPPARRESRVRGPVPFSPSKGILPAVLDEPMVEESSEAVQRALARFGGQPSSPRGGAEPPAGHAVPPRFFSKPIILWGLIAISLALAGWGGWEGYRWFRRDYASVPISQRSPLGARLDQAVSLSHWPDAARLWKQLQPEFPDCADILLTEAVLQANWGRWQRAADAALAASQAAPKMWKAHLLHCKALSHIGRGNEALGLLSALPSTEPTNISISIAQLYILRQLRRFDEAAVVTRTLCDQYPNEAFLILNHGMALADLNDKVASTAFWGDALARHGAAVPELYSHAIRALARIGAYTEAQAYLDAAPTQRPNDVNTFYDTAYLLLYQGETKQAIGPLTQFRQKAPDHPGGLWATLVLFLRLNDADPRIPQFIDRLAFVLDVTHTSMTDTVEDIMALSPLAAQRFLQRVTQSHPHRANLWEQLIEVEKLLGHEEAAAQAAVEWARACQLPADVF
jgi:tetratricopeptide (TPR) repeat protein